MIRPVHIEPPSAIFKLTVVDCQSLGPTVPHLARIWESKVREEKKENADEKDKTKQTARNQLRFRFHRGEEGDGHVEKQHGEDRGDQPQLEVGVVLCAHPAHDWDEEEVDELDDIAEEEEVRDLEEVEDDQRQGALLLHEEHVKDQPDGEEEEGEAEEEGRLDGQAGEDDAEESQPKRLAVQVKVEKKLVGKLFEKSSK